MLMVIVLAIALSPVRLSLHVATASMWLRVLPRRLALIVSGNLAIPQQSVLSRVPLKASSARNVTKVWFSVLLQPSSADRIQWVISLKIVQPGEAALVVETAGKHLFRATTTRVHC